MRALIDRIRRYWCQHGPISTLRFLSSRIFRHHRYLVFEADLGTSRVCPQWVGGERLQNFGPENIDAVLTPALLTFLGGDDAAEYLQGVRNGDRLFIVAQGASFLHCAYILFKTRQTKILGENDNPPLIASCKTVPEAQGRGLYRRALMAELCYLTSQGYRRAVIETDPENIPSRKGIEAAGFRLCRKLSVWILLNWLVGQYSVSASGTNWRLFSLIAE